MGVCKSLWTYLLHLPSNHVLIADINILYLTDAHLSYISSLHYLAFTYFTCQCYFSFQFYLFDSHPPYLTGIHFCYQLCLISASHTNLVLIFLSTHIPYFTYSLRYLPGVHMISIHTALFFYKFGAYL